MSELSFDAPVWRHGKALRKGYTTGSCATAAAKVAALMVLRQHLIHQVSIVTPSGVTLCLNVESPHIEGQQAIAAIRKDGGDDVDATHGMLIFARVTLNDSGEITLTGGEGIGTVTRKGVVRLFWWRISTGAAYSPLFMARWRCCINRSVTE